MKKQVKNLCLAAVVLAVLGGIYAIVSKQEPESTAVSIEPLASLTVTDLTYSNAQGQWHFVKDGDTWSNADDADCPLNSDAVQDLVNSLQELTAARRFDQPDQDADYGLDVPDYTVTLSDGNTEVTLTARTQDTVTYLKTSADDTVYASTTGVPESLANGLTDWIAYENIPYATESALTQIVWNDTTIERVDTTTDQTESTQDASSSTDDEEQASQWRITDSNGTRTVTQDTTMDTFLDAVRNLYVIDCADYNIQTVEQKQAYGLDSPNTLQVTYTTSDGTASYQLAIGTSNGTDGYYAMLNENGIVLVLEGESVDHLRSISI